MKVATHLSKHPKIEWVRYPGLSRDPMHRLQKTYLKGKGGPLVVIGLKGGRAAGEKMINSLKLFSHVANVGDAKSLAIHPASTTHSQLSDEEQVATCVEINAIEQTKLLRQHRVDGVGRPKFDFHTDRDGPAARARASFRGHRAHRRHHQGSEPGTGADRVITLPPSTPTTQSTTSRGTLAR